MAFVGDIMCGDSFSKLGWGAASCIAKYGPEFVSLELRSLLKSHDVVLCNLESVLSDIGRRTNRLRTLHMRGRPETAQYLADWGFTVVHVANNHILEHGQEAACDTVRNVQKAGVRVVGAGPDEEFGPGVKPVRMVIQGIRLSIIGACFHDGRYAFRPGDAEDVFSAVETESRQDQFVIVSVHWGDELIDRPSLWQRMMARRLFECGARLVVGHHAHVFQGIASNERGLVAYGLGNFIFDSVMDLTGWSVVLSVSIDATGITTHKVVPVVRSEHFRPMLACGGGAERLSQEVVRRNGLACRPLANIAEYEEGYHRELAALEFRFRRELWRYIFRNWFRCQWVFWPQILLRPIMRRLDIW